MNLERHKGDDKKFKNCSGLKMFSHSLIKKRRPLMKIQDHFLHFNESRFSINQIFFSNHFCNASNASCFFGPKQFL
jgi:hypothetical protein